MGGAMGGMVMGSTISEVARNALSTERIPSEPSPKDVSGIRPPVGVNSLNRKAPFDVNAFMNGGESTVNETTSVLQSGAKSNVGGTKFCAECGNPLSLGAKFCSECGHRIENNTCPDCGTTLKSGMKFCPECGYDLR